jgi:serine phosphatase RsbU (regulator of sigma subunit)/pSer/pThr/pTyr-binding forkhead associated (FHA) protein
MPLIEFVDGPNKGKSIPFDRDELIVGRLTYCDIVVNQKNVSRQHARLLRSGGEYFVEDLNSTNGTFLNGKRVRSRTRLKDQDLIRVYNVTVIFQEVAPQASASPSAAQGGSKAEAEKAAPRGAGGKMTLVGDAAESGADKRRNVGVNAYEKLKTVLEIHRTLGSTLDIDLVLPKILDGLFTVFPQSDRAYILFPDPGTSTLQIRAEKQKEEGTLASSSLGPISQTVARRVMSQGEAILSADGLDEADLEIGDSVLDFPIRSMMCAPLLGRLQEPLGIIYVDTNDPYERFHTDDLEVLLSVAATAGQAVEYAQAHQAKLNLDRRERELATAREVQLHFLPQIRPEIPGYRFFDHYASAQEVGGDYYGYLTLPDQRTAISLGDVSGKGISAALIMARLCSEVRYRLGTAGTLRDGFHQLNEEFAKPENDTWFVTFVLCVLDTSRHLLTLFNAGHMSPICRRSAEGEVEELGEAITGPPLGCDASISYDFCTAQLEPGDSLLIYTDGITEAMNAQHELYGRTRLHQAIRSGPERVDELCNWILDDVKSFTLQHPQNDDICLMGFQREP